jgi:tRNA(Arg) A34 adenosine deaminase TadA
VSFSEWDQRCMTLAVEEARRAADRGEVPVGAVLARGEGGARPWRQRSDRASRRDGPRGNPGAKRGRRQGQ